jgi:beta-lactamase regulating signal transducer with metallopeptidase domain
MSFNEFTERVGWSVLHSLWQLTALAIIGLVIARSLLSTNKRYSILCVTLLLMLIAPVVTFFLCPTNANYDSFGKLDIPVDSSIEVPDSDLLLADDAITNNQDTPQSYSTSGVSNFADHDERTMLQGSTRQHSLLVSAFDWFNIRWLGPSWLAGVCLLSAWHLVGYAWLSRRVRVSRAVPVEVLIVLESCLTRLQLRRRVEIRQANFVRVPCIFGWFRPVVLVPLNVITGMSTEHLRAVLLHELAHIRRYDGLVNWFQSVIETALFFHPLVWIVSRRLREEREHCADEIAADALGDRLSYAKAITAVAELARASETSTNELVIESRSLVASTGGLLRQRIERLLQVERPMERHRNGWGWLVVLVVAAGCVAAQSFGSNGLSPDATAVAESPKRTPKKTPPPKKDETKGSKETAAAQQNADADAAAKARQKTLTDTRARGVKYILTEQKKDPTFKQSTVFKRGTVALVGLALLKSGVSAKDPAIVSTLKTLDDTKPTMVYGTSLELLFRLELGVQQPVVNRGARDGKTIVPSQKAKATELAQLLVDSAVKGGVNNGTWSYHVGRKANARGDHSNTSFALWALTEASRAGIKMKDAVFTAAVDHLLTAQLKDGGWSYVRQAGNGTGSMTSGCLAALLACSECGDGYKKAEVEKSRQRGLAWLAKNFSLGTNPKSAAWHLYYLMHFRRAAHEADSTMIGDHRLMPEGIKLLAEQQRQDGSWHMRAGAMHGAIGSSMALLFLSDKPSAKKTKK